ncbi:MAG: hypothetical protein ACI9FG_001813, partial [Crocinitomicaceae bacterium]
WRQNSVIHTPAEGAVNIVAASRCASTPAGRY